MLALLLVVSLAADPSVAAKAAAEVKAKELVAAAKKLFSQKRYAEASRKFQDAYLAGGNTANIYNMGKCYERLGLTSMALRSYREYQRIEPKAEKDAVLEGDIANGARRLREKGVQQLVVYADPPNSRITIDGEPLDGSPAYVELKAGEHVLAVSADGYETTQYPFVMNIAVTSERTVNLRQLTRDGVATGDAPREQLSMVVAPRERVETRPIVVGEGAPKPQRHIGTWVSAGVVVAGAATAVGLGVAFLDTEKQLQTLDPNRPGTQTTALMSRTGDLATGTNIALGVAAVAAVTAVVLFFVEGR